MGTDLGVSAAWSGGMCHALKAAHDFKSRRGKRTDTRTRLFRARLRGRARVAKLTCECSEILLLWSLITLAFSINSSDTHSGSNKTLQRGSIAGMAATDVVSVERHGVHSQYLLTSKASTFVGPKSWSSQDGH